MISKIIFLWICFERCKKESYRDINWLDENSSKTVEFNFNFHGKDISLKLNQVVKLKILRIMVPKFFWWRNFLKSCLTVSNQMSLDKCVWFANTNFTYEKVVSLTGTHQNAKPVGYLLNKFKTNVESKNPMVFMLTGEMMWKRMKWKGSVVCCHEYKRIMCTNCTEIAFNFMSNGI